MIANLTWFSQRYGNMFGDGEYAQEVLLIASKPQHIPCMPKPIMSHQRNRYTTYRNTVGLLALRQTRVSPHDHVSSAAADGLNWSGSQCPLSSTATPQGGGRQSTLVSMGVPRVGKDRGF